MHSHNLMTKFAYGGRPPVKSGKSFSRKPADNFYGSFAA